MVLLVGAGDFVLGNVQRVFYSCYALFGNQGISVVSLFEADVSRSPQDPGVTAGCNRTPLDKALNFV